MQHRQIQSSARLIRMVIDQILSAIDTEIAKLQQAKQLLSSTQDVFTTAGKRGRPRGSKNAPSPEKPASKRTMSAEG